MNDGWYLNKISLNAHVIRFRAEENSIRYEIILEAKG